MRLLVAAAVALAAPAAHAHPHELDDDEVEFKHGPGPFMKFAGPKGKAFSFAFSSGSWIGVHAQSMTPELREHFGAPKDRGVLVAQVVADSPAARAGLKTGDIIVKAGDTDVKEFHDLAAAVSETEEGKTLTLEVIRDRRTQRIDVKVEENPKWQGMEREVEKAVETFKRGRDEAMRALEKRLEKLEKQLEELRRQIPKKT
jgi:C-terminal processing protease CtpA/Prc